MNRIPRHSVEQISGVYRDDGSMLRLGIAGSVAAAFMLLFMLITLGIIPKGVLPDLGPLLEVDYVTVEEPQREKPPPPPPPRAATKPTEEKTPEPQPVEQVAIPESPPLETAPVSEAPVDVPAPPSASPAPVASAENVPQRIVSTQELDNVSFEPIFNPRPDYPVVAQQAGISGYVDVDLVINDNGTVRSFSIVSVKGHPAFGTETAKVLPKWRFPPPRIKGKKTSVNYLYRIRFTLNSIE